MLKRMFKLAERRGTVWTNPAARLPTSWGAERGPCCHARQRTAHFAGSMHESVYDVQWDDLKKVAD